MKTSELMKKHVKLRCARGLEVGVGCGDSAATALEAVAPERMDLVDCYRTQPRAVYPDDYNVEQKSQDKRMENMLDRIENSAVSSRTEVHFYRRMSDSYVEMLRSNGTGAVYDFIFLDANHSYEAVKADLEALWPFLKDGGVMFCHDYCRELKYFGVIEAVDEFVDTHTEAHKGEVSDERFPVVVVSKRQ